MVTSSCKKDDTNIDYQKPKVVTAEVSSISYTMATSGGTVSSEGGYVTKKGACWSAKLNPTIADTKTNNDKGIGSYTSILTGLEPGASYHIRAYASYLVIKAGKGSTEETVYGQDIAFTTSTFAIPTISTTAASNISAVSASSGGVITSDGGSLVSAKGVCWSTGSNPTIMLNTKTNNGTGIGTFISNIIGLDGGTTYHVRAYATNTAGTGYGPDIAFVTTSVVPSIITASISSVTTTTAICGGNVSSDGGSAVSARGVIWGTSNNLTITMSTKTNDGNGTGAYTSLITGLSFNTTYYVRAYAINGIGTAYGFIESFRTGNINAPTVITAAVSNITQTTATCGGNVTSDGGASVASRGICWSTTTNPTIALNTKTVDGSSTGLFVSQLTGLNSATTYYVRAYATTNIGTSYGNQVAFKTLDDVPSDAMLIEMVRGGVSTSVKSNQWYYVAITKASNLASNLYINGSLVATGKWENQSYDYNSLFIGASYYTSWGSFFKGYLDEFRMSKTVRTAQEIATHYASNQEFTVDSKTIGLWHFNESSGTKFSNAVPSSTVGNLYNNPRFEAGKFGNCLYFDGVGSRGDCNLDIPEYDITFEFWFKFSNGKNSTIISAYGMNNSHINLRYK